MTPSLTIHRSPVKASVSSSPSRANGTGPTVSPNALAGNGPAIVRIDEREIPQLATLVDVRYARRGELQRQLRERIMGADPGDPVGEGEEGLPERVLGGKGEEVAHERLDRFLPALVLLDPAGID